VCFLRGQDAAGPHVGSYRVARATARPGDTLLQEPQPALVMLGMGSDVAGVTAPPGPRFAQVQCRVPCGGTTIRDGQDRDGRPADLTQAGRVHRHSHEVEGVDHGQGDVEVGVDVAQPELDRVVPGRVEQRQRRRRPVGGFRVE